MDFCPERFLPAGHGSGTALEVPRGGVAGSAFGLGPYQLTTFSHGAHVCPGQR